MTEQTLVLDNDPTDIAGLPPAERYFGNNFNKVQRFTVNPEPEIPTRFEVPSYYKLVHKDGKIERYEGGGRTFTLIRM